MSGKLAFELGKFRVVRNAGTPKYVIESQAGKDALGVERWETVVELGDAQRTRGHNPVEYHLLELMVDRIVMLMQPDTNKKTPPYDEVQL